MKDENNLDANGIGQKIYLIRGQRVMLDSDLATLYGVVTKNLNKAVGRNRGRFPGDFMFQLSAREAQNLRFQFGTSSLYGGRRYLPFAFTQEGIAMLSGVLRSERAVQVNIAIMRTFIQLREILGGNPDLARKVDLLEQEYDSQFKVVFDAIRSLLGSDTPPRRKIKGLG